MSFLELAVCSLSASGLFAAGFVLSAAGLLPSAPGVSCGVPCVGGVLGVCDGGVCVLPEPLPDEPPEPLPDEPPELPELPPDDFFFMPSTVTVLFSLISCMV